jgi:hypothetical protein
MEEAAAKAEQVLEKTRADLAEKGRTRITVNFSLQQSSIDALEAAAEASGLAKNGILELVMRSIYRFRLESPGVDTPERPAPGETEVKPKMVSMTNKVTILAKEILDSAAAEAQIPAAVLLDMALSVLPLLRLADLLDSPLDLAELGGKEASGE